MNNWLRFGPPKHRFAQISGSRMRPHEAVEVSKETADGKIQVTMTLTDPAEGRAWAVWLLDHEPAA